MHDPGDQAPAAPGSRAFEADGAVWLAEVTGQCVVGGVLGAAVLDSIHFQCRDDPAPAVRLAYLPRGAFPRLLDEELERLHRAAPALVPRPEPASGEGRRRVDGTR